jgi:hypothetical protein
LWSIDTSIASATFYPRKLGFIARTRHQTSACGTMLPTGHVHLSVGYQGQSGQCRVSAMSHMRDRRRELLFRKMKNAA